jgi:hypothetical protein
MDDATSTAIARALEQDRPVRLHARDGEVLVARILSFDEREVRFAVLRSTRPERYAVCDSTGVQRRWDELERAVLVSAREAG